MKGIMKTHRETKLFSFPLPDSDGAILSDLVNETGASKAELIRKGIKIIYSMVKETKSDIWKEAEKQAKQGKIPNLDHLKEGYALELERRLNSMMYHECRKKTNAKHP
jgi:hypothetical protein